MVEKEPLFSCYFCSKFNISLIILPISFVSIRFLHDKMYFFQRPEKSFKIFKYNLPYLFYLYLPKLFSIILFFITKWKTRNEGTSLVRTSVAAKNYHILKISEYGKKMILFLFLVGLLEVLYDNIDSLIYYYIMNADVKWLIEKKTINILFVPIFSYFILDNVLYKHHSLGLVLGLIGGIIVNACRFFLGFSLLDDIFCHILNIFLSSFYSLALVLIKYIMKKYILLSPYLLLFYDGVVCIFISILLTLLEYFIVPKLPETEKNYEKNYKFDFFKENFSEIITIFKDQDIKFYRLFFISMILSFCYYISNIYILYHYSPYLNIFFELILPIDSDILDYIFFAKEEDHLLNDILKRICYQTIGYIFLILGALILNEIIVLNFLGFNSNTFLNIAKRSEKDSFIVPNVNDGNESAIDSQFNNSIDSIEILNM